MLPSSLQTSPLPTEGLGLGSVFAVETGLKREEALIGREFTLVIASRRAIPSETSNSHQEIGGLFLHHARG
jgi:hypothetical protein